MQNGLSSAHATFVDTAQLDLFRKAGWLIRSGTQFHWSNDGYASFDDFLATLASRKRRAIRKERAAAQAGLTIRRLRGAEITEAHWDAFWAFYQDTGSRKWGTPYLTRRFFTELHATMRDDVLLVLACHPDGTPVAGALNFIGRETLFGRYWGCIEDHPCLHFELCYYQAIEWAITRRMARVEAGAQGEHKLARGYLPTPVHSLHWIAEPAFRDAVARYLDAERRAVDEEIEVLTAYGPFRRVQSED